MCHFITLVAPSVDAEAVRAVMERHGRTASPIDNPSVRKMLLDGEHQYLTTSGHCDCGTALVPALGPSDAVEEAAAKDVARLKRKGWSDAKIARAAEDRRRVDARPGKEAPDSIELWNAVLEGLGKELDLPYAGVLVAFYSGAVATESLVVTRRDVRNGTSRSDALGSVDQNELTIFPLARSGLG